MVNHQFQLKRSLLALLFQLALLLLMGLIWIRIFPFSLALMLIVIALLALFLFLKRPQVLAFEYLDHKCWSIQWSDHSLDSQLKLEKMFDHYFYMVLHFEKKTAPHVIWRDQVSLEAWKKLKVMAKLL
ncbi:hypothetical protein [Acinetobacter ihumii]|uniref:hypothetical protein n=1 Tax=Acinetobacter ihumii TaxID=2483802 RepID=UPI00103005D5|nr:hypothetical protein [Acinetobacter ihumii]